MKLTSWLFTASGLTVTIGAGVIALQQSTIIPNSYDTPLKILGAYVLGAGGILFLAALFAALRDALRSAPARLFLLRFRGTDSYEVEPALIEDLDFLYSKYTDMFGPDLVPIEEFARWMKRNPNICFKVIKVRKLDADYRSKIVGFFDFEPLTHVALQRLCNTKPNEIPAGLREQDIRSAKGRAKGYYVGSIGATSGSTHDRAATLLWAFDFARKLNSRTNVTLFANPFTPDGVRLCKTFGFVPLNRDKSRGLWRLDMAAGADIPDYEKKLGRLLLSK